MPTAKYGKYKPPLFKLSEKTTWLKFLQEEGYVVIKDIINDEITKNATKIFKKEWCQVSPNFKWVDKKTWIPDNSPIIWGKSSAMFNGFGQSRFVWMLRTQPSIHEVFSKVYNTKELAVALDGFSVFISPKQKSSKIPTMP